jgi:hypothetical protein
MARFLTLAAVVLGLAGGAYWMGLKSRDMAQARTQGTDLATTAPAASPVASPAESGQPGSGTTATSSTARPAAAPIAGQPRPAARATDVPVQQVTRTTLATMNASAMQLMNEIDGNNIEGFAARVSTGDGEAAFALFHKAMACANAPDTEEALMGRIEDIYQGSQDNPNAEKMMDQLSEHFVQKYEDCANFPRGLEGMLSALDWLQSSVDLGFPPAQGAYVTYGKSIVQQAALRRPELVLRYREQVMAQMQMMLGSGNPDAFIVHAREYASGDLLEQDWFLSYTYAHAAGLANPGDNSGEYMLKEAERHLSPSEVRDAREQARELCERHCR